MIQTKYLLTGSRVSLRSRSKIIILFLVSLCSMLSQTLSAQKITAVYLNPSSGNDANAGTRDKPLRSLAAAAKIVNEGTGDDAVTIYLSEGVYALTETTKFMPANRKFTKKARLTIRAEILPDDSNRNTGN